MEVTFSGLSCVDFLVSIIINTQEDFDTHQKCDVYEIVFFYLCLQRILPISGKVHFNFLGEIVPD